MDPLAARLAGCFKVIFPSLDDRQIRQASQNTLVAWDSVAMVTLINVVEEEFGTQIDMADVEQMTSFPRFLAYVKTRQDGETTP